MRNVCTTPIPMSSAKVMNQLKDRASVPRHQQALWRLVGFADLGLKG